MQETILALLLTFSPANEAAKNEPGAKPMHGGGIIINEPKPMHGGGIIINEPKPLHGGGIIINKKD